MAITADLAHRIPAGWYPDRADRTRRRWWDGTQWTDYYSAAPIPESPPRRIRLVETSSAHSVRRALSFKDRIAASVLAGLLLANGLVIAGLLHAL